MKTYLQKGNKALLILNHKTSKKVFVDTGFLVGMSNPRDQWHAQATTAQVKLDDCYFVTTESVLTEVLTYFCEFGPRMRFRAAATVDLFLANPDVESRSNFSRNIS